MTNAAEYPARVREAFPEAKLSVQSFRDRTVLVVEPADLHDILQHLYENPAGVWKAAFERLSGYSEQLASSLAALRDAASPMPLVPAKHIDDGAGGNHSENDGTDTQFEILKRLKDPYLRL